jgi:hypothetical protein
MGVFIAGIAIMLAGWIGWYLGLRYYASCRDSTWKLVKWTPLVAMCGMITATHYATDWSQTGPYSRDVATIAVMFIGIAIETGLAKITIGEWPWE